MRPSLNWVLGLVLLAGGPVHGADALNAAAAQVAAGDYRAALASLDRLENSSAAGALFLRATALAGSGRLDEAALLFERLIAEHPAMPEAYNNLAALRARQGQLAEAKELLERGLRTDARYAMVYDNLSTIYVEMARSSYAKALRLEAGAQPPRLAVLTGLATAPAAPLQVAVAAASAPAEAPAPLSASVAVVKPAPAPVPATRPEPVPAAKPEPEPAPAPAAEPESAPATEPEAAPAAAEAEPESAAVAMPAAPTPTAEPAAAAAAAATTVPEPLRLAVVTALNGWARAWSQQNVDAYLAYYDANFAPEGMERLAWEAERRSRITRPAWIKVELEEVQVEAPASDAVVVTLRQRYAAPGYKDTTLKRMQLVLHEGNWMITSETSLKVLR